MLMMLVLLLPSKVLLLLTIGIAADGAMDDIVANNVVEVIVANGVVNVIFVDRWFCGSYCDYFCLQISFFALAIASKKIPNHK